jgi:tol-pal system protein YbgF
MTASTASNGFVKAQIFLGLLIFGMIVAPTVASAQSNRDITNRLNRVENELETLGRAVYRGESPPPGAVSGGGSAADTEVRIQQFESQISAMTGRLEEQDYQIRQLREQLEKLQADIEVRMGGGTTSGGFTNGSGGFTNTPTTGGMQYQDRTPQPEPVYNAAPDTPTNNGGGQSGNSGYQWNSGSAGEGQLGTYTEGNAASSGGDTAATLYENAFSLLKGAQYNEAEKEFNAFLSQYPNHALAGNATYWLGETYYVRGQFENAAKTFAEGYQKDPKGPKAADNLLKMGMSLSGMNKKADACTALGQIEKQFASSGPVLRRAQQEMTRLGC